MFGKVLRHPVVSWLILVGFLLHGIQLFVSGDITLYIHPRYTWFSLVMGLLGLALLSIRAVITTMAMHRGRQSVSHSHGPTKGRGVVVNSLVITVLILAWLLPPQTLSQEAVGRRGVRAPMYSSNVSCPTRDELARPFNEWWYQMDNYPIDCFTGQSIEFTGFVIGWSPSDPLPDTMFHLGRLAMSCCAIDAQPFALPVASSSGSSYQEGQWYTVHGVLETVAASGTQQLVIKADAVTPVNQPNDPYMYLGL